MGLNLGTLDFPVDVLDELIEEYKLHNSWPVDLQPLYDGLNIRIYKDMPLPDCAKAFSAMYTEPRREIAVFGRGLDEQEMGHAMGHEMGHLLLHKLGYFHGCISSMGGRVDKEELEADLVGAYLMMPGRPVFQLGSEGASVSEIAMQFSVTERLVRLRFDLMLARDEFGVNSWRAEQWERGARLGGFSME